MAAVWQLPVVFVCENNLYATEMPLAESTRNTNIASKAASYGMPGIQVDGNNVLEVYEKAGEAIRRARQGEGPTLLECLTYRWHGHHEGDPGVSYRSKEEIAAWRKSDPIAGLRANPAAMSLVAEDDFKRVDAEVAAVLEDAAQFALSSPLESEDTAFDHVYHSTTN
jgi:TPP-dependent pyruvate/acetoin dehydrogenase alpha subunit